mgnify:CR=1 FL=1
MCEGCNKELTQEEIHIANFGSLTSNMQLDLCNDCYVEGDFLPNE